MLGSIEELLNFLLKRKKSFTFGKNFKSFIFLCFNDVFLMHSLWLKCVYCFPENEKN